MKTFITRAHIDRYPQLLQTATLDECVNETQPIYYGLGRAVDSLSPDIASQLPRTFYYDAAFVVSQSLLGHVPRVVELENDQVEDYILGQGVLLSLKAEATTRERMATDG